MDVDFNVEVSVMQALAGISVFEGVDSIALLPALWVYQDAKAIAHIYKGVDRYHWGETSYSYRRRMGFTRYVKDLDLSGDASTAQLAFEDALERLFQCPPSH